MRLVHSGKVRDLYDVGEGRLLIVTSDKISAFDVVMNETIPDKGRVLTAMTAYWYGEMADIVPTTLISAGPEKIAGLLHSDLDLDLDLGVGLSISAIAGRAMLVKRAEMLPIECIVRGYLAGQAFDEYMSEGTVHGTRLPKGLQMADRLSEPIFTPSTKAQEGHDENISFSKAVDLVGLQAASEARDICLALYDRAATQALDSGFILADTKFELGYVDGVLSLCDEVCTPDSSRWWPADEVVSGQVPPSFDKQPLRDWLAAQDWNKMPPPPTLPAEIVEATSIRYRQSYERVTGRSLSDWYGT